MRAKHSFFLKKKAVCRFTRGGGCCGQLQFWQLYHPLKGLGGGLLLTQPAHFARFSRKLLKNWTKNGFRFRCFYRPFFFENRIWLSLKMVENDWLATFWGGGRWPPNRIGGRAFFPPLDFETISLAGPRRADLNLGGKWGGGTGIILAGEQDQGGPG